MHAELTDIGVLILFLRIAVLFQDADKRSDMLAPHTLHSYNGPNIWSALWDTLGHSRCQLDGLWHTLTHSGTLSQYPECLGFSRVTLEIVMTLWSVVDTNLNLSLSFCPVLPCLAMPTYALSPLYLPRLPKLPCPTHATSPALPNARSGGCMKRHTSAPPAPSLQGKTRPPC